jgi:hypothetical protein
MKKIKNAVYLGRTLYFITACGIGSLCPSLHVAAVDVVLPPEIEDTASTAHPASEGDPKPPEKKIVHPKVPKNLIENYYITAFADYFGPSPWVISSTP